MNSLKIKLNPYRDYNTASLDDRPFSTYSELSNFMKEPFLNWADKLLDTAEREINDSYNLVVAGEQFEKMILQDMQNEFDACQSYGTDEYAVNYSANERYQMILQLAKKYGIQFNLANYRMNVCSEVELPSTVAFATTQSDIGNAFLIVTRDLGIEGSLISKMGSCIAVVISNQSKARSIGNAKYIWEITEDRLQSVLNAIADRFVKVPFIVSISNELVSFIPQMEAEDREKHALITEIDMFVSIGEIPSIEVGNSYDLEIKTIPENSPVPMLGIESSNLSILSVDGNKLYAMAPGQAVVKFYREGEILPFDQREVTVFQNNFIAELTLDAEKEMGIQRIQKIEVKMVPADAEDAGLIEWTSSDRKVAVVDDDGNIRTISAGKTTITAKASRVSSSIDIVVLPNIEEIKSSVKKTRLYVGDTKPMSVKITPQECFDDSCVWKTSDSKVAIVEPTENGKTVIRATGIGDCVLTCTAIEGGCSTTCEVKVEATFKKRENNTSFLGLSLFCTVIAIFCTFFNVPLGILISGAAGAIFAVVSIVVNWRDFVWALIFMAIDVALILNHFAIIDILSFFK